MTAPTAAGRDDASPRPSALGTGHSPLLSVRGVAKRFGGVRALNGVDLDVPAGRTVGVIGPNGSGKSTLFDVVAGVTRADAGTVRFNGIDVSRAGADRINRLGLARTFQLTRLFGTLTAHENLVVVARDEPEAARRRADELLGFLGLAQVRDEYADNLSYGQQKLVEFARLTMNDPMLLLLDEPFAGVNPVLEQRLLERMAEWLKEGKTILLTDHEMGIMMEICDELYVLDHGEVIAHGPPAAVRTDERVMEAYFGR
ncbi:MAG: ABC transporter ATP-binding protein [Chloroflexota bacterium]|nr:ABC transporter ATP-binding protein [Chloroflexota bacterium]